MENGPLYILQLWFISIWKIPLHCKLYTASCIESITFKITILIWDMWGISWLLVNPELFTSSKGLFSFFHTFGKNIHVKSYCCSPIYSINDDLCMKSSATLKFWFSDTVDTACHLMSSLLSPVSCSPLIVFSPLSCSPLLFSYPLLLLVTTPLFSMSPLFSPPYLVSLPLFPLQPLVFNPILVSSPPPIYSIFLASTSK